MNSDLLSDWLLYINSNRPNEGDFGLNRLRPIYSQIVKEPLAEKTILVGGTNGKGSTSEYLKNMLISAGYKVGIYTSPHLMEFNERIRINDEQVKDKEIVRSFKKIDQLKKQTRLTYFDFSTLAAFDIFSEKKLDFAILEIGIGGQYDPVNLIESDLSIITNIDFDHEQWLGYSLEEIGSQKAAILKPGKFAVLGSGFMPKSVTKVAREICSSYQLEEDFLIKRTEDYWSYSFPEMDFKLKDLSHGSLNNNSAASAITAFKLLCDQAIDFKQSIENTFLQGRCHVVDNFVLDVSHNPSSVINLTSFLDKNFKDKKFTAIFAAMDDKDCSAMIKEISDYILDWNICLIDDKRFNSAALSSLVQTLTNKKVNKLNTVYSAIERGYHEGTPQIVFGSFLTVSEAYKALIKIKNREIN